MGQIDSALPASLTVVLTHRTEALETIRPWQKESFLSVSTYELVINTTWNGEPIPTDQYVFLTYNDSDPKDLIIEIDAPYHGDAPPDCPIGSTWALWEYEVVELFLVSSSGPYLELEFGPHGHYLALWLEAPRQISKKHLKLAYDVRIEGERWLGSAKVPKHLVPAQIERWNAFSISGPPSERQYLSWDPLPGEAPDFHQTQAFRAFPSMA